LLTVPAPEVGGAEPEPDPPDPAPAPLPPVAGAVVVGVVVAALGARWPEPRLARFALFAFLSPATIAGASGPVGVVFVP
jgi:hypothetical protein